MTIYVASLPPGYSLDAQEVIKMKEKGLELLNVYPMLGMVRFSLAEGKELTDFPVLRDVEEEMVFGPEE